MRVTTYDLLRNKFIEN